MAITRARENLWIVDKSPKRSSIQALWTARNLIQLCNPHEVPHFAVESTPDDWYSLAEQVFRKKLYAQAQQCYQRALKPREAAVAYAYHRRQQAKKLTSDSNAYKAAWSTSGQLFNQCSADAMTEKFDYSRIAAECFVLAGDDWNAAKAYVLAKEYELGLKKYWKAGLFPDCVQVIRAHRESIPSDTIESVWRSCRVHYFTTKKFV